MTTQTKKLTGQELIDLVKASQGMNKLDLVIQAGYYTPETNKANYTDFYEALLTANTPTPVEENTFEGYTLKDIFSKTPVTSISVSIFDGDLSNYDIEFEYEDEEGQDLYCNIDNDLEEELKTYIGKNSYDLFAYTIYDNHNMVENIIADIYLKGDDIIVEAGITQTKILEPITLD